MANDFKPTSIVERSREAEAAAKTSQWNIAGFKSFGVVSFAALVVVVGVKLLFGG